MSKKKGSKGAKKGSKGAKKGKKGGSKIGKGKGKGGKGKGSKGSKSAKGSKTSVKSASAKGSGSETSIKSAKTPINATPEQIAKNKELLEKICKLLAELKADQVTRGSKDDLDKIQLLIKNITFRDAGEMNRVREVPLSEKQKAVIKLISGVGCDMDMDTMAVTLTVTDAKEGDAKSLNTTAGGTPKINFPYEKLEFAQTK